MPTFLAIGQIALATVLPAAHALGQDSTDTDRFAPNTIVHVPGAGVTFVDGTGSRYRLRMMIAPMTRFVHQSNVTDDSLVLTIRRARFSFDARLPYELRTQPDSVTSDWR